MRRITVMSVALGVAALIHHVDDLIAGDHVGSTSAVTIRVSALLAIQTLATIAVADPTTRRSASLARALVAPALLGLVALWWFWTVVVAHTASITRPVTDIVAAEPAGWAPVFLGAVLVAGATAPVVVVLVTQRMFQLVGRADA